MAHTGEYWHRWLERRSVLLTTLAGVAVAIGGLVEIVPMMWVESNVPKIATVQPYTPLELQGRDLYIREGCMGCHSQMIRPFRSETERYGEYSKPGEFVYDHPFHWSLFKGAVFFLGGLVLIKGVANELDNPQPF